MVGAAELITACSEYLLAFCLPWRVALGSDGASLYLEPRPTFLPESTIAVADIDEVSF